jgi:dihydroxyacetone kinase-like predicted kinase
MGGRGDEGYCIDAVLKMGSVDVEDPFSAISRVGHEVVTMGQGDFVKVHLHAADEAGARRQLEEVGNLVNWKSDDLKAQMAEYRSAAQKSGPSYHERCGRFNYAN